MSRRLRHALAGGFLLLEVVVGVVAGCGVVVGRGVRSRCVHGRREILGRRVLGQHGVLGHGRVDDHHVLLGGRLLDGRGVPAYGRVDDHHVLLGGRVLDDGLERGCVRVLGRLRHALAGGFLLLELVVGVVAGLLGCGVCGRGDLLHGCVVSRHILRGRVVSGHQVLDGCVIDRHQVLGSGILDGQRVLVHRRIDDHHVLLDELSLGDPVVSGFLRFGIALVDELGLNHLGLDDVGLGERRIRIGHLGHGDGLVELVRHGGVLTGRLRLCHRFRLGPWFRLGPRFRLCRRFRLGRRLRSGPRLVLLILGACRLRGLRGAWLLALDGALPWVLSHCPLTVVLGCRAACPHRSILAHAHPTRQQGQPGDHPVHPGVQSRFLRGPAVSRSTRCTRECRRSWRYRPTA